MYRHLVSDHIIETLEILAVRIGERFPDSGLSKVCQDLLQVARETTQRCEWISRPHWGLRTGMAILILILIAGFVESIMLATMTRGQYEIGDFVQIIDASISSLVFIGAAVIFLVTMENRIKRKRTLDALNELRAIAHVIDMHQLTKDPERLLAGYQSTQTSPQPNMTAFQLTRYLNFCSEMLSLVGKISALYSQEFNDTAVLAAVNDLENLATGLSRKIWQKIMILHMDHPV